MGQEVTGLPGIVAKLIVIWDKALGAFATVTEQPISEGCGITAYHVNITETGEALVVNLSQLLFNLVSYLTEYLGSLTAAAG
jgi:hypothetical protein